VKITKAILLKIKKKLKILRYSRKGLIKAPKVRAMATPVTFFINKSEIEQNVLTKSDQGVAYIIYQNNHLMKEYLDITKKLNELNVTIEELEEYTGKLEKSKTCLKGYVHNEIFISKKYKIISDIYSNFSLVIYLVSTLLSIINLFSNKIVAISLILLVQTYFVYYTYIIHKTLKIITESIKKSSSSNIYIDNLIDNM
jgi:hypothetical protein